MTKQEKQEKQDERLYLVKYEDNWADELDIYGSSILDQRQLDFLNVAIDNVGYFEYNFGTNEGIEYESAKAIRATLEFQVLSDEEVLTLKKFGFGNFGEEFVGRVVEMYVDYMTDEEFEAVEEESNYFFDQLRKIKYNN